MRDEDLRVAERHRLHARVVGRARERLRQPQRADREADRQQDQPTRHRAQFITSSTWSDGSRAKKKPRCLALISLNCSTR